MTTVIHAVSGVLFRDNSLLIAERPLHKPLGGFWEFPGGKIETNESSLAALERELDEEIGIKIQQDHPIFLTKMHNHYQDYEAFVDFFLITRWQGTPLPLEGQTLTFAPLETLWNYKLLPGLQQILDALNKQLSL